MNEDDVINPSSGSGRADTPTPKKRRGPPLIEGGLPVLSLRLEGMRLNLHQALLGQQDEISELVQQELDRACTVEALRDIVEGQVTAQVREKIAKEIEHYFSYGEGGKAIEEAVAAQLQVQLKGVLDTIAKRAKKT